MELKVNLRLQTILELIHFVQCMELETAIWILIGVLMTPLIILSIGKLGLAIIWQLFWLGVHVGILISVVSGIYLFCVACVGTWKKAVPALGGNKSGGPKCTLLDVILSVIFHSGAWLPEMVWNPLIDIYVGQGNSEGKGVWGSMFGEKLKRESELELPDLKKEFQDMKEFQNKKKILNDELGWVKMETSESGEDYDYGTAAGDSKKRAGRRLKVIHINTSPQGEEQGSLNTTAVFIEKLVEDKFKPSAKVKGKAVRRNRAKSSVV